MRLDDEALQTVFRCFDMDHSGGIDINELQQAISLLGIPHMTKQKVEKMFADADEDGSGEIDFDEFRHVVEVGDGGQLARIIEKVAEDQTVRDIMKQRCRPTEGRAAVLCEQLARVKEERQWFNKLHMLTCRQQVDSANLGYVNDRSVYTGAKTGSLFAAPSPPSQSRASRQSPSQSHQLPSARAAQSMLGSDSLHESDELELAPFESPRSVVPGATPRSNGLRRIFGTHAVTENQRSPRDFGSPSAKRGSPQPMRGSPPPAAHALAYHSPRPGLPALSPRSLGASPRTQRGGVPPALSPRAGTSHEASPRRLLLPAVVDGRSVSNPTPRPPAHGMDLPVKQEVASW